MEVVAGDDLYVQVWGYVSGQTQGVDAMLLLDQFRTPAIANTAVITLMADGTPPHLLSS